MTMSTQPWVAALLLGSFVCVNPAWGGDNVGSTAPVQTNAAGELKAEIVDAGGEAIGAVSAREGAMGVLLRIRATSLPSGFHGLHLHAVGDCSDLQAFKRAGGHIEHTGHSHGYLHASGVHRGDLPNLYVHTDGVASADFFAAALELSDLRDADGAALIIHAEPDNYWTQPIGAAGERIACAAFGRGAATTMNQAQEAGHE